LPGRRSFSAKRTLCHPLLKLNNVDPRLKSLLRKMNLPKSRPQKFRRAGIQCGEFVDSCLSKLPLPGWRQPTLRSSRDVFLRPSQASFRRLVYARCYGRLASLAVLPELSGWGHSESGCRILAIARLPCTRLSRPSELRFNANRRGPSPGGISPRARHIWARADTLSDLTDGELEYLATGKLPGASPDPQQQDDAA
jgi:hypothetical protein